MHLLEKMNGILEYVADADETPENQAFLKKIIDYRIQRQGASIIFFAKSDNKQILYFNTFDNSMFIHDSRGYSLAADFGTKRFPVGKARSALTKEQAQEQKAIQFERDLSFPITVSVEEKVSSFKSVTLAELLIINDKNQDKLYEDLAELFNRCADFTPGKQDEYLSGGKKVDKYCRFNLDNHKLLASTVTDQIFLLDSQNKIIGTISATIIVQSDGTTDVYFYDEIVDYSIRLKPYEKEILEMLYKNDKKLPKDVQKAEIAKIIEPRRLEIMQPLFAAARQQIIQTISTLSGSSGESLIKEGKVHAFIRAAAGRVSSYKALACGEEKSITYVIHGPSTAYTEMLDHHVKNWAEQQLKLLKKLPDEIKPSTTKSSYLTTAFNYGVTLATIGILAYKLWPKGESSSAPSVPNLSTSLGMVKK